MICWGVTSFMNAKPPGFLGWPGVMILHEYLAF